MRILECLEIAEFTNKPIVDIGPSQRRLGGLQRKNERD